MRARAQEADVSSLKITSSEAGGIVVNGQTASASPSHWAFGQLSTSLKAPAGYLRTLPAPLAVDCLMNGVKHSPVEKFKFMTLENEDSETRTLQAVTSPTYGRIWDADVADAALRIVDRTGGRFFNPKAYAPDGTIKPQGLYASDRDIFIFMIDGGSLLDVGDRAKLNRGFFMWNSEVGARTFGLTTFLFNVVCGNHIVWGAQDVNSLVIRHSKNGPARFDGEAVPELLRYVESSSKPLEDAVRRAMAFEIPKIQDASEFDSVLLFARKSAMFTKTEIREAIATARVEEGQCATLWDLSQGLTAYARGFEFMDARTDLESRAGKLLDLVK